MDLATILQRRDWENPSVTGINRLPAHALWPDGQT